MRTRNAGAAVLALGVCVAAALSGCASGPEAEPTPDVEVEEGCPAGFLESVPDAVLATGMWADPRVEETGDSDGYMTSLIYAADEDSYSDVGREFSQTVRPMLEGACVYTVTYTNPSFGMDSEQEVIVVRGAKTALPAVTEALATLGYEADPDDDGLFNGPDQTQFRADYVGGLPTTTAHGSRAFLGNARAYFESGDFYIVRGY